MSWGLAAHWLSGALSGDDGAPSQKNSGAMIDNRAVRVSRLGSVYSFLFDR